MHKVIKIFAVLALLSSALPLFAQQQQPLTPEEQQQQMYELIDKQIEEYENTLELSSEQVFFVDSILTHDYFAMTRELSELTNRKVSFTDAYIEIQDKWYEAIYNAFQKLLTPEQWQKYLKTGGLKDKKARDKRALKRNNH